jgi:DUF438 domain-containing protein
MLSASEENMTGKIPENLAVQILSALPLDITFIDEDDII